MKSSDLHGIWKVVKHKLTDQKRDDYNEIINVLDQFSLKGARLEINQNGHMAWSGVSIVKIYPFLKAKNFNLVGVCNSVLIGMYVGKGSLKVEFEVQLEEDVLLLHHKHGFVLEMQRISEKTSGEKHFSLCDALNDEEFKDLEIIAKNGKYLVTSAYLAVSLWNRIGKVAQTSFLARMKTSFWQFSICLIVAVCQVG